MWVPFNAERGYTGVTTMGDCVELCWEGNNSGVTKKKKLEIRSEEQARQIISDLEESLES